MEHASMRAILMLGHQDTRNFVIPLDERLEPWLLGPHAQVRNISTRVGRCHPKHWRDRGRYRALLSLELIHGVAHPREDLPQRLAVWEKCLLLPAFPFLPHLPRASRVRPISKVTSVVRHGGTNWCSLQWAGVSACEVFADLFWPGGAVFAPPSVGAAAFASPFVPA
jgi:hypothetical protein